MINLLGLLWQRWCGMASLSDWQQPSPTMSATITDHIITVAARQESFPSVVVSHFHLYHCPCLFWTSGRIANPVGLDCRGMPSSSDGTSQFDYDCLFGRYHARQALQEICYDQSVRHILSGLAHGIGTSGSSPSWSNQCCSNIGTGFCSTQEHPWL